MSENRNPQKTMGEPWPEEYPAWHIEFLESSMEETGMSRKEAEESLQFELSFGGILMQEYVAKLKAQQERPNKPETSR